MQAWRFWLNVCGSIDEHRMPMRTSNVIERLGGAHARCAGGMRLQRYRQACARMRVGCARARGERQTIDEGQLQEIAGGARGLAALKDFEATGSALANAGARMTRSINATPCATPVPMGRLCASSPQYEQASK